MRKAFILAVVACFVTMGPALAFHAQGVASCNGCHTMHNSENGQYVDPAHPNGNQYLLKMETPSDVCLSCHSVSTSRGVFAADPLAPNVLHGGGDFVFLTEDNINDGHGGGTNPIPGYASGHSIVAPSKGVAVDPVLSHAPGGTFPSASLGCSSCHDPHGNMNFRLLYGIGSIQDGLYTFTNAAPTAAKSSNSAEANNNHTAYQSGMSAWCGNCHGDYHNNNTALIHPSGATLGGTIATAYNLYSGTSNPTGGTQATAYLAAVPFEDPSNTPTSTVGPSASSQVMCLTCHRAHATSAPNAGRWDFNITHLRDDGVESGSYAIPNPYDTYQRSLCNKCHVKDINDALN